LSANFCDAYLLHLMFTTDFPRSKRGTVLALLEAVTSLRTTHNDDVAAHETATQGGRAYDMALGSRTRVAAARRGLDVGCGNGFIAHHLTGLLGTTVVGLDVGTSTTARINYLPYDGRHFPFETKASTPCCSATCCITRRIRDLC
jgi:SAM-dependent methyltransferase